MPLSSHPSKHPKVITLGCGLDLASPLSHSKPLFSAKCPLSRLPWTYAGLPTTLLGALHKSGFQNQSTVVAVQLFLHETNPTHVHHCPKDDLPHHIKGDTWFYQVSQGFEDQQGYIVSLQNNSIGHNENTHIEFIRNQHDNEDDWYRLEQNLENHFWYMYTTQKVPRENKWGLG